jgi:2-keto-4-pentenoate hydratase
MTQTDDLWTALDLNEPRLRDGFARMRRARAQALAGGAQPAGWKVGINDPRVRQRLCITSSVIGYLLADGLLPAEQPVSLRDTLRPGAEVELAFHIQADVPAGADHRTAKAAIGAVSPAIEIIDIDMDRFDDLPEALARNVWHRAAILGPPTPWSERLLDETAVEVAHNGRIAASDVSPRTAVGIAGDLIRFVAGAVAALGETLRAGDVVLSGMLTPVPVWPAPGDRIDAGYGPLGHLSLTFA